MVKHILVQAGHQQPLEPGFEGQTGAAGEAPLVADIQHALVRVLNQDPNFHGVPAPGKIDPNVQVDGAVFLHADGNDDHSAHGFSVGYPRFEVNKRLANMIASEIEKIPGHPSRRSDNNTADMEFYYGFSRVQTPGPEVIIEHGFVSNPQEHQWLTAHVDALARAEYHALCQFFGLTPKGGQGHPQPHPQPHTEGSGGPTGQGTVTPDSKLRAPARAPQGKVLQYLLARPCGEYSHDDVRAIAGFYYAAAGDLDPLLLVAQMVEETGHLTSFWSQRPRRNMAGIGVTGVKGEGVSFPSLKVAVRAHAGRLLAYALPSGAESPAQKELIDEALAFRDLPHNLRGAAPTLKGLAGTWAADPQYAVKLARIANDIRNA
jgi:N-acetylmuramoyl-L-alanine amidase/Mannosyl-glycoprotein endo-beta-N-acetylglucosaminidase